jgi:glycosyltransferase involved in cell wall biosynthesis
MDPLISIIMNCHNCDLYVQEALDSVYGQTYTNWEIIFFDNHSEDSSRLLAKNRDERLKYFFSKEKLKLYDARNHALGKCSGEYVTFLDCDDIWVDDKLEEQIKQCNVNRPIVYSRFQFIDKDGFFLDAKYPIPCNGKISKNLLINNPISISSIMIYSRILKKEKFDPCYNLLGDFELWFRLSLLYEYTYVDKVLEYSRQHDGCTSLLEKDNWIVEQRNFYKSWIFNKKITNKLLYFSLIKYILKCEILSISVRVKKHVTSS